MWSEQGPASPLLTALLFSIWSFDQQGMNLQLLYTGCGEASASCLILLLFHPTLHIRVSSLKTSSDLFVHNFFKVVEVQIIVWNMTSVGYGLFCRILVSHLPVKRFRESY